MLLAYTLYLGHTFNFAVTYLSSTLSHFIFHSFSHDKSSVLWQQWEPRSRLMWR